MRPIIASITFVISAKWFKKLSYK